MADESHRRIHRFIGKSENESSGSLEAITGRTIHLYFGKASHEIDARTLGVCLTELSNALDEIGPSIGFVPCAIQVRDLKKGSFDLITEVIPVALSVIGSAPEYLNYIDKAVELLATFIKLKSILRGKEPKSIEKIDENLIQITGNDNATTNITIENFNIFKNNKRIDVAINNQFRELHKDESINSFQLKNERDETIIETPRSDFESVMQASSITGTDRTIESSRVSLVLKSPVLDKRPSSWAFISSEGEKITARMEADDFLDRITHGEKFAMGDRLVVELETTRDFDKDLQTHKIKKRVVTKVYDHESRPHQTELGFDS